MRTENTASWSSWSWALGSAYLVGALLVSACGDDSSGAGEADASVDAATQDTDGGSSPGTDAGRKDKDAGDGDDGGAADAAQAEECEAGEVLEDGACVEACSLVACGDHGACAVDPTTEVAACVCDSGYEGAACDSCAPGQVDDGDGNCVGPCVGFDCGGGTCGVDNDAPKCECHKGYEGATCDSCAPGYGFVIDLQGGASTCQLAVPATTNMKLWLDADDDDTFTLANGSNYITAWESKVGTGLSFAAPAAANRPKYDDYPVGTAQSGVSFDGANDVLADSLNLGGTYSVFIVLQVDELVASQTILSAVDQNDDLAFWLRTSSNGEDLEMTHTNGMSENVSLTGLSLTERTLVEVHRAGLGLSLVVGASTASTVVSADPLTSRDFELGRRADTAAEPLSGTIHEIITVSPGLGTTNARAAYRDYLKAKWNIE